MKQKKQALPSNIKPVLLGAYIEIPSSPFFYIHFKGLELATHWRDEEGNLFRLPAVLSSVYAIGRQEYLSYSGVGKPLYKTNQQFANDCGCSFDNVKKVVKPLLKAMGLLTGTHNRQRFHSIEKIRGTLITINHTESTLPNMSPEHFIKKNKMSSAEAEMYTKNIMRKHQLSHFLNNMNMLEDNAWMDEVLKPRGVKYEEFPAGYVIGGNDG